LFSFVYPKPTFTIFDLELGYGIEFSAATCLGVGGRRIQDGF